MSIRASTIFAVLIALVIGLGAAIGVKASGILSPSKETARKETPAPLVLVTAKNVFQGEYLEAIDVRLRPAKSQAEADLLVKNELLPPVVQAAAKRMARVNIPADTPIKKEYLDELGAPTTLKERLSPGMRAVSVGAHKIHSAGGLIEVGDWVDVYLTSTIDMPCNPDCQSPTTLTGQLACKARVIAKRNNLWPVPNPAGSVCPIHYVLETNPYRAALIEYAKDKGIISLQPLGDHDKQQLEARRNELMSQKGDVKPVTYSIPDCPEYADEDKRINSATLCCNNAVGEGDLMRIFGLKLPEPAPTPVPPAPPIQVNKITGTSKVTTVTFEPETNSATTQSTYYGNPAAGGTAVAPYQVSVGTVPFDHVRPGYYANPAGPGWVGGVPFRFTRPDKYVPGTDDGRRFAGNAGMAPALAVPGDFSLVAPNKK